VIPAIRFIVSAWQLVHSCGIAAFKSFSCFDACGLWQLTQPPLSAAGQCSCRLAMVVFTMSA
jgi:hypothetical protein